MDSRLIFITGGARSGKSVYALRLADALAGDKVYLATAIARDKEMKVRVEAHKRERPSDWNTVEEVDKLPHAVTMCNGRFSVLLLDCLTMWISYLMLDKGLDESEVLDETNALIEACKGFKGSVIIVSNEIGMGIVPMNELSRKFRDVAGRANQAVASAADEVYLVVAGIPLKIKGKHT